MHYPISFASLASRLAIGALCLSSFAFNANAAALYWDTSGSTADSTFGGSGTWDTTTANWNNGAVNNAGTLQAWTGGFSDEARFLNLTSGAVTVSGTIQASSVSFGVRAGDYPAGNPQSVYTLTGGTLDLRTSTLGNVIQNWTSVQPTTTINSNITLFNGIAAGAYTQNIRANGGTITINGGIQDISNVTGTHSLSLESFGGHITINGNITRSGSSSAQGLVIGGGSGTGQSNSAIYTLGGNNSGSGSVAATLARGTLVLNNNGALGHVSSLSVLNANATAGAGDTARVLIGTAGVSINRAVSFTALTATDTNDVRAIGSQNTAGTATFTGTVTVNATAPSGTGSSVQFTAESGGRVDFTGSINGSGAITKVGGGVVVFSRANAGTNHSGGVTVNEGTFLANGFNSTGSSTVTVNDSATLGGNGTVAGAITLAAGARMSPGTMAADNTTSLAGTFNGSSSLTWNSNNTTAGMFFNLGADQGSSDQLVLAGAFTKGSGSTFIFDFTGSTLNESIVYTLVTFGSTNFDIGDFSAINGGGGVFAFDGNTLTYAAVPEPSSYAALIGAFALTGVAFRRRSR